MALDFLTLSLAQQAAKGYTDSQITNINSMEIHVCLDGEYNTTTGVPTIQNPDDHTFYLVPNGDSGNNNIFNEYVYVNNAWELFDSAEINFDNVQIKWSNVTGKPSISGSGDDVSVTGKLTVGTNPTANMDVATKQYVDGNLSTLNAISYSEAVTVNSSSFEKISAYFRVDRAITSDNNCKTLYFPCSPDVTYTVNKTASARFRIGYTTVLPANNVSVYGAKEDNSATSLKVTTGDNAAYVVVQYYDSASDTLTESAIYNSIEVSGRTVPTAVDKVARSDLNTAVSNLTTALNGKQDTLAFDTTPTANSTKPVTSGGIKTALDGKQNTLTFDTTPTASSTKPVTSGGIKTALNAKQDKLTFDTTPTASSTNPVTSGGIKTALDSIQLQVTSAIKSPLKAATAAAMTDTTKVYIYTGSETGYTFGNWYYHDGSSWVSGGVYNATAFETDKTLSIENMAADAGAVGILKEALTDINGVLPTKADKDGVVASAEQLLSDVGTEDKVPYLFRATPYDSTRVDEEVVGVSVGWNQYMPETYKSGSKTFDADATYYGAFHSSLHLPVTPNHIYFCAVKVTRNIATNDGVGIAVTSGSNTIISPKLANGAPNGFAYAINSSGEFNTITAVLWNNYTGKRGFASGDSVSYDDLMLIDLTAWFGSTIADYAYTLEQATAGSGVAFIKALLPSGYIPYSAPKLESVSGLSGHKFVGFNAWDEEVEIGSFDNTTGEKTTNANRNRSKNPIPVIPNTAYYVNKVLYRFFYDADMNFISRDASGANLFTTPSNAHYMNIEQAKADWSGTETCINLSDPARNGQYEPYKETTYALDSDLTLRGILKMDEAHNVYADGDVYLGEGKKNERYAEVDLGTLEWEYGQQSGTNVFYAYFNPIKKTGYTNADVFPIRCPRYISVAFYSGGVYMGGIDKSVAYAPGSGSRFYIVDSAYTDATTFKAAMSGVKLVYEKATPTTETALPYASPQICEPGGTEEYVYAEGGSGVPVGHHSKYQKNMRSELERVSDAVPDAPSVAGTYSLKATVTAQGVTYAWVSD